MEDKEILIELNWDIRFKNITDRERFEKIIVLVNEEVYAILTDPKTELKVINEIVHNLQQ
jgi:hypothetical protein